MKKLDYISVLRALAILAVIMVHVGQEGGALKIMHPYIFNFIVNGARGVQLFYILSALTLTLSYHSRKQDDQNPKLNYYIRRYFRIAPLFYLAIGYYLWQDGFGPRYFLGSQPEITTGNILSNFFFVQSFNPYWISSIIPGGWSVAIEMVFYCMFPFIIERVKTMQQSVNLLIIFILFRTLLLIVLTRYPFIPDSQLWIDYLFLYLPNQLPLFALGIVAYFLLYGKISPSVSPKQYLPIFGILVMDLLIGNQLILPKIFWFGVAFVFLILGLRSYEPRLLFNKFFIHIGNISYSLYLSHFGVIYFANKYGLFDPFDNQNIFVGLGNIALNFSLVFVISALISSVLYKTIEVPMQEVGKKLIVALKRQRSTEKAIPA